MRPGTAPVRPGWGCHEDRPCQSGGVYSIGRRQPDRAVSSRAVEALPLPRGGATQPQPGAAPGVALARASPFRLRQPSYFLVIASGLPWLGPSTVPELRLPCPGGFHRATGSLHRAGLRLPCPGGLHRARASAAAPWWSPPRPGGLHRPELRLPRPGGLHRAAGSLHRAELRLPCLGGLHRAAGGPHRARASAAVPWWPAPRRWFPPPARASAAGALAPSTAPEVGALATIAPKLRLLVRWRPPPRPGGLQRLKDRAASCPPRPSFGCRAAGALHRPELRALACCTGPRLGCRAVVASTAPEVGALAAIPRAADALHGPEARLPRCWRLPPCPRFAPLVGLLWPRFTRRSGAAAALLVTSTGPSFGPCPLVPLPVRWRLHRALVATAAPEVRAVTVAALAASTGPRLAPCLLPRPCAARARGSRRALAPLCRCRARALAAAPLMRSTGPRC